MAMSRQILIKFHTILIKFYVKHHQAGERLIMLFGLADWIGTLVAKATFMWQCLVVHYKSLANVSPGVQTGSARGSRVPIDCIMEKKLQIIFFSETIRPTAYVFSM